jgi:TPR repeat protein
MATLWAMVRRNALRVACLCVAGLVAVGAQAHAVQADTAQVEHLRQQGELLVAQGRFSAALPLLTRAARYGNADAQVSLGDLYANGGVSPAGDHHAAHWFQLAAAQGHPGAQYQLGAMYEHGSGGLPKDDLTAIQFYIRSAQQNFEPANLALGVHYELGIAVPRNRMQAIQLLLKGGAEGIFAAHALTAAGVAPRFVSATALGNYLAQIPDSPTAAAWSQNAPVSARAGGPVSLTTVLRATGRSSANKQ